MGEGGGDLGGGEREEEDGTSTKMRVDFGGTKVADGAYFPPVGWKYSNLKVKAEPF